MAFCPGYGLHGHSLSPEIEEINCVTFRPGYHELHDHSPTPETDYGKHKADVSPGDSVQEEVYEDFDEPEEPGAYYEDEEDLAGGQEDPDQHRREGENVVVSGDVSAAAAAKINSVQEQSKKKVPDDERTTTPYMTKYERARVLGTRALQIRYAANWDQ